MKRIKRTHEEKLYILSKSENRCAHCGTEIDEYSMTVEHFFPLYNGGEDILDNIVALCKKCNEKKSNYIYEPEDYYTYLNLEHINKLDEYLEDKYYRKGYPLGNVSKLLYVAGEPAHNLIRNTPSSKDKLLIRNKYMAKLALEQAYPAEGEDILKFVIKAKNYNRKLSGKAEYRYDPEDKAFSKRVLEEFIKRNKVYMITSLSTKEYYGYFMFDKIKNLDLIDDKDNIYQNLKNEFILSAYDIYKYPQMSGMFFKMIGKYCKHNETYIPILEAASPSDYTALTQMDSYAQDKYSFITVEYINNPDPIPKENPSSPLSKCYEELIYFFRVPKFFLYGQPMTEKIYIDIIKEIKKCERSITR